MGRPESRSASCKTRRDGWTPERQLAFLGALTRTRSVTLAARAVGMSRESAYRLRGRREGALFAAAWDALSKGHIFAVTKKSAASISRANPPKVTKSMKYTNPRFNAFEKLIRDFRKMPV